MRFPSDIFAGEEQFPEPDNFADKSSVGTSEIPEGPQKEDQDGGLSVTQKQIPGTEWDDSSETVSRAAVIHFSGTRPPVEADSGESVSVVVVIPGTNCDDSG